jgi:hypothetical protein
MIATKKVLAAAAALVAAGLLTAGTASAAVVNKGTFALSGTAITIKIPEVSPPNTEEIDFFTLTGVNVASADQGDYASAEPGAALPCAAEADLLNGNCGDFLRVVNSGSNVVVYVGGDEASTADLATMNAMNPNPGGAFSLFTLPDPITEGAQMYKEIHTVGGPLLKFYFASDVAETSVVSDTLTMNVPALPVVGVVALTLVLGAAGILVARKRRPELTTIA